MARCSSNKTQYCALEVNREIPRSRGLVGWWLTDDVQSILRSLSPQCLWASHDGMQIDLIRYEPLEAHFKFFFQQFPRVLQLWRFFIKWYRKEWSIKLRIDNGGWHETLNSLHGSRCEMLHFVTSYMKKNRKQTRESAQNELEIFFKTHLFEMRKLSWGRHF